MAGLQTEKWGLGWPLDLQAAEKCEGVGGELAPDSVASDANGQARRMPDLALRRLLNQVADSEGMPTDGTKLLQPGRMQRCDRGSPRFEGA